MHAYHLLENLTSFRGRPMDLRFEAEKAMHLGLGAAVERDIDFEASCYEVGAERTAAVVRHCDSVLA
jgi:hypothetical protein